VHLQIPRRTTRLVVRAGSLQESEFGTPAVVVDHLGVVVADRVTHGSDVRDRQHLLAAEWLTKRHPETTRVHEVIDPFLEISEPPGLPDLTARPVGDGVRLDEALDLLPEYRVILEAIELDRLLSRSDRRRRRRCIELLGIDVRVPVDLCRIDEEEELPPHVVGVVQDQRVLLNEGALVSESGELKDPGVQITALLSPDGLEVHRTHLPLGLKAEVTCGDALREEARAREIEGHVADLESPQHIVFAAFIEEVDPVGGVELPRLVEVHIDLHPIENRSVHDDPELYLGAELWNE
jgi:hypothetical protein